MSKAKSQAATMTTVQLNVPIERGEQTIDEINLRKPSAGELRGMALSDLLRLDVDALITIIPRISLPTLTENECREMDVADLTTVGGEVVGFFMGASPKA